MSVRLTSLVLAVVALVLAVTALRSGGEANKSAPQLQLPVTPVLSPRRLPALIMASERDPILRDALTQVMDDGPPSSCLVVAVGGRQIFAHEANLPVIPASNQKLVTAQLTLDMLGEDYRYTTKVTGPAMHEGTINGDLTLVGGGDPVLGTKAWIDHFADQPAVGTPMESLADQLVKNGLKHVTGSVLGNERRYDGLRSVATWPSRYLEQRQLGPLSALTVNGGLTVFPEHGTEENRTDVTLAENPPRHGAETLLQLLVDRGVTVDGTAGVSTASTKDVETLAQVKSPPMADIVRHMLSESDNQVAEMFVKEIGYAKGSGGTTAAGLAAMQKSLGDLGIPVQQVRMMDGSGLDPETHLTCAIIYRLLSDAGESSSIGKGLAVSGESGTLRERFDEQAKGRIKAKTGTLNEVTALSGFADSIGGPALTFAYVANGELVGPQLLSLQDRLVDAMVNYPGGLKISTLGPQ